jgi:hypothetical protein
MRLLVLLFVAAVAVLVAGLAPVTGGSAGAAEHAIAKAAQLRGPASMRPQTAPVDNGGLAICMRIPGARRRGSSRSPNREPLPCTAARRDRAPRRASTAPRSQARARSHARAAARPADAAAAASPEPPPPPSRSVSSGSRPRAEAGGPCPHDSF